VRKFLLFIFITFVFLICAENAYAKDYYFPKVNASYTINANGSIDVVEQRTYSFDGSFSFAYIDIPLSVSRKGYSYSANLTDFRVTEKEKPLVISEQSGGDTFHARWTYSALNETKTFTFYYTLSGALGGGVDFDEFYWQVIGSAWDKRTEQAEFLVIFPSNIPRNRVYSFAHGPLNGKFDFVNDNSVKFTVSGISPKQFVEIRLVFPKGYVQTTESSSKNLQQILGEEKSYLSPTVYKRFLLFGLVFANLLWAAYWIWTWFKHGREYEHNTPKYIHDPPSQLPPALVEILLSQGNTVSPRSFIATLFDLANRKYLVIADRRVLKKGFFGTKSVHEYTIIFRKNLEEIKDDTRLRKYEKLFVTEIAKTVSVFNTEEKEAFGVKDELLAFKLADLKTGFKSSGFRTFWQDFEKEIKEEAKGLGFLEQGSETRHNYFVASLIIIAVLNAVMFFVFDTFKAAGFIGPVIFWVFILAVRITSIISGVKKSKSGVSIFSFMKRWTTAYGQEARSWQSFKNFLGDIGHFQDKMPHDLVLWEKFLVYGALFGLTDKILKLMPLALGEAATPNWYVGSGGSFGTFSDFSSGVSDFSSNLSSSFSAGSSGGFSGGGGGGGGGGGAG
jgi:uncharacterized membrane protein